MNQTALIAAIVIEIAQTGERNKTTIAEKTVIKSRVMKANAEG